MDPRRLKRDSRRHRTVIKRLLLDLGFWWSDESTSTSSVSAGMTRPMSSCALPSPHPQSNLLGLPPRPLPGPPWCVSGPVPPSSSTSSARASLACSLEGSTSLSWQQPMTRTARTRCHPLQRPWLSPGFCDVRHPTALDQRAATLLSFLPSQKAQGHGGG